MNLIREEKKERNLPNEYARNNKQETGPID